MFRTKPIINSVVILIGLISCLILGYSFTPKYFNVVTLVAQSWQTLTLVGIILAVLIFNLCSKKEMNCKSKMFFIAGITITGFILALVSCFLQKINLHDFYPCNTFLFIPQARFSDFTTPFIKVLDLSNVPLSFSPGFFLFAKMFTILNINTALIFWLSSSAILLIAYLASNIFSILNTTNKNLKNTILYTLFLTGIFLCSYPIIFSFDRGNFEITLLFALIAFIWLYQKEKYLISGIILAFAICIKFYPFLFLILFLSDRKFKEFFFTVFITTAMYLLILAIYPGGFLHNITHFLTDCGYTDLMVIGNAGLEFNSTLYGFFKYFLCLEHKIITPQTLQSIYTYFAGAAVLLTTLYIIFVEKTFWKKLALIIIMRTLLVFVSAHYAIILLLIPMWLFIKSEHHDSSDLFYASLYGMMMIPYNYLILYKEDFSYLVCANFSIIVYPIILLFFMLKIMYDGLKNLPVFNKNKIGV